MQSNPYFGNPKVDPQNIDPAAIRNPSVMNRESFSGLPKVDGLVSDKDIDVGNTTANFNFDVTANFGYNNSQMDADAPEGEVLGQSKKNESNHFKIQSFGEVPKLRAGEMASSNLFGGHNLSEVQKQGESSAYDSKGLPVGERIYLSNEHMFPVGKHLSMAENDSKLAGGKQSNLVLGSLLGESGKDPKLSKVEAAQGSSGWSESAGHKSDPQLSKVDPANVTLTLSNDDAFKPAAGDSQQLKETFGPGKLQSKASNGQSESMDKDIGHKMSEITLKGFNDSNAPNDISFQQDLGDRRMKSGDAPKFQPQNFHKTDAVDTGDAFQTGQGHPQTGNLFFPKEQDLLRSHPDQLFQNPGDDFSRGQESFPGQMGDSGAATVDPKESTRQLLAKMIQSKLKRIDPVARAELRNLNAELRQAELEEKRLRTLLDQLNVESKIISGASDTDTIQARLHKERLRRFENLAAKSENENYHQVFKSLAVNRTHEVDSDDLRSVPLSAMVFLKQEMVLEKIISSTAELRRLDDEMEKGNLYELMNEIEVKLHHYDFKSDDFVQLKEVYLQRLQLERELEELKKKGQEYDQLL